MITKRIVVGSQTKFYREGLAITVPGAAVCSAANKPGITDPLWLTVSPIKWTKNPTHKTEKVMEPSPGKYVATDVIATEVGMEYKGKLEKQSNLAYELTMAAKATGGFIPDSPTAGGQYNPLSSSPVVRGWLHVQEYDQDNVLVNTVDNWVALEVDGGTNNDDKSAETPVKATVLFSVNNSGTLA
jgi:hypothetical protein